MNAKPIPPERRVLAEVIICSDTSCTEHMPVSKEWLQTEWRTSGVWRSVGLMFSECTGMCSTGPNAFVVTKEQTILLNNLREKTAYDLLLKWAKDIHANQQLQPVPHALASYSADLFRI